MCIASKINLNLKLGCSWRFTHTTGRVILTQALRSSYSDWFSGRMHEDIYSTVLSVRRWGCISTRFSLNSLTLIMLYVNLYCFGWNGVWERLILEPSIASRSPCPLYIAFCLSVYCSRGNNKSRFPLQGMELFLYTLKLKMIDTTLLLKHLKK